MHPKRYEFSWSAICAGVIAMALVLGVLILGGYAAALPKPGGALPAAPSKDKDETPSQVYQHSYDEVFQASLETVERMGLFVTDKDKDKGTINGNGEYHYACGGAVPCGGKLTFEINVETVSAKPEVRVTMRPKFLMHITRGSRAVFPPDFFMQLQKALSTYH